jgi:hypothetical protein
LKQNKKAMKSIIVTTLFALCLGIGGCQETCGIIAEPTLGLNFVNMATPNFKNIKMLGAVKELPNSGTARPSPSGQDGNIYLPINLNAKSTTYVFEQSSRIDTLTVYYQVVVKEIITVKGTLGIMVLTDSP